MKSEQIGELAKALAAAQAEMTGATKDSTNPHFKSRYADLAAIIEAIRLPLTTNGLSYSQCVNGDSLHTLLMHLSGQWIESIYPLRPIKNDPQGFMAALTYARRGALAAITGCPAVDDDGNAASGIRVQSFNPHDAHHKSLLWERVQASGMKDAFLENKQFFIELLETTKPSSTNVTDIDEWIKEHVR